MTIDQAVEKARGHWQGTMVLAIPAAVFIAIKTVGKFRQSGAYRDLWVGALLLVAIFGISRLHRQYTCLLRESVKDPVALNKLAQIVAALAGGAIIGILMAFGVI